MNNWKKVENGNQSSLQCSLKFKDFSEAWGFMCRVALIAEQMRHHPTWENTYNAVEITLSSHDAGNVVTEKDEKMAEKINQLL